jgi:Ribbon-helix-helix protein, copG family
VRMRLTPKGIGDLGDFTGGSREGANAPHAEPRMTRGRCLGLRYASRFGADNRFEVFPRYPFVATLGWRYGIPVGILGRGRGGGRATRVDAVGVDGVDWEGRLRLMLRITVTSGLGDWAIRVDRMDGGGRGRASRVDRGGCSALRLTRLPEPNIIGSMSLLTVSLPEPLAERLTREARERPVTPDVIVRQALEQALPEDGRSGEKAVFEKLKQLVVNDPASPSDLATNPAHMEGFGVSGAA